MNKWKIAIVFLITAILLPHLLLAEDEINIEPAAMEILSRMSEILGGARQYSVHNEATTDEPTNMGDMIQLSITVDILFRRPDGLRAVVRGDLGSLEYWYDGRQIAFSRTRSEVANYNVSDIWVVDVDSGNPHLHVLYH